MKKALFAFLATCLVSGMSLAAPTLKCELTEYKKLDVFLHEELNLINNPTFVFVDQSRHWSMQIGDFELNSRKPELGQTLKKRSQKVPPNTQLYSIWVNNILQYQFELQKDTQKLSLFWWGTGRKSLLATFQCGQRSWFINYL